MPADYERLDLPVPGGTLRVGAWGASGPPVLALHGVTANHLCWAPTARALPAARLLAPDLRGRGGSGGLPGPYGMAAHADDAVAVLDRLGIERAVVVGHSMGGFVALVLAHRHPDRVSRLLLVDGGLPVPFPRDTDPDTALEAVIGPAARRLVALFPDRATYLRGWRDHPAMTEWNADLERYLDYDLIGAEPALRSSCSLAAVRADTVDLATGTALLQALAGLTAPDGPLGTVELLRAPAGLMGEPGGLYPPAVVDGWVEQFPALRVTTVAGTNHYTILLGPTGAAAVAAAVQRELAAVQGAV